MDTETYRQLEQIKKEIRQMRKTPYDISKVVWKLNNRVAELEWIMQQNEVMEFLKDKMSKYNKI